MNNFQLILNHLGFKFVPFFKIFIPLALVFSIYWLRLERFSKRLTKTKLLCLSLLILNPFTMIYLSDPSLYIFHLLFFLLISIGFETINHGMIIRGMIISSFCLAFLSLSGIAGFVLAAFLSTLFYFAVKWQILKKYTFASFTLLLFPALGLLSGAWYLTLLYDGAFVHSIMESPLYQSEPNYLLNWLIFIPVLFLYWKKDKKGLNQVKRYIVPFFFLTDLSLNLLGFSDGRGLWLGICALCVAFEMISDSKTSKSRLGYLAIFSCLSWVYFIFKTL